MKLSDLEKRTIVFPKPGDAPVGGKQAKTPAAQAKQRAGRRVGWKNSRAKMEAAKK